MSKDVLGGALAEVAGPLQDFAQKLGGSEGTQWLAGFKRFLRKENPWNPIREIPAILTIGGVSADELLTRLEEGGFEIGSWARDIMGKAAFTTLADPTEIQPVCMKVRDLGFRKEPTTTELFAKAQNQGYKLCPAETGPHLRLVLTDQPLGDWFAIAMEPILDSGGDPEVFRVRRRDDGGQWLFVDDANPDSRWGLEDEIVFCK